jgi:hypothetical protein
MELQKLAAHGAKNGFPVQDGPGLGKQLDTIKQSLDTPFPAPADSYTPSGERNDGIELDFGNWATARNLFGK